MNPSITQAFNNNVAVGLMFPEHNNPYEATYQVGGDPFAQFLGIAIGKKAKARKKQRQEDRRNFVLEKQQLKNAAKLELAKQGIAAPTGLQSALSSVSGLVSSLVGGNNPAPDVLYPQPPLTNENKIGTNMDAAAILAAMQAAKDADQSEDFTKSKAFPFIIGGVALLIVIVLVFMMKKK